MTSRSVFYLGLVIAVVLFLGGAGYVAVQVHAAGSASTTVGTIHSASVDSLQTANLYGNTYRANVTYSYFVHGHQYTGHTVFPGHYAAFTQAKPLADVANQYHSGQSVTVYYRPSHPANSYLIPRYGFVPGFLAMMIAPFIAATVLTPGFNWIGILKLALSRSSTDTSNSTGETTWQSGSDAESEAWNDPPSLTNNAATQTSNQTRTAVAVAGWQEWIVWGSATTLALAVVGLYLILSTTQYTQTAYLAGLVAIVLPVARAAAKYRFD